MARPSDGYAVALIEEAGPVTARGAVGVICPRCHRGAKYPLHLPQATPVATLTKVMGYLADAAALLHTCPDTGDGT
jgi:hypothetical protein